MSWTFWILFILLNSCYFWPRFILNRETSSILPFTDWSQINWHRRLRSLLIRMNYDVFRLSLDFLILILVYPLLLHQFLTPRQWAIPVYLYFGASLAYQLYYTAFDRIYHVTPVLYNDWFMLKMAVRLFFLEYDRKNILVSVMAVLFAFTSWFLIIWMLRSSAGLVVKWPGWVVLGIIAVAGLYSVYKYEAKQFPQTVFQSQLQSFIRNLIASRNARDQVQSLTLEQMKNYNIDREVCLEVRPNIYFIVVESYGRIVLDESRFREDYVKCAEACGDALRASGWSVHSNLSVSPITAGASWISYTSMLYGLNVRGQGLYLTLFKNPYIDQYDSLFNWLKRQGYITYRLSNLGGYEKMTIPYETYSRLYGIDHWILHKDLGYTGPEYGFGPSPPDQYALHFAHERIERDGSGPFALFFITQNSHTPFESPSQVASNWKDLCDPDYQRPVRSKLWSKPDFARYGSAIRYQLEFLTDFIVKKGGENDVFVLIGDHQPASLSIEIDKYETPVHIIAKDEKFARSFEHYGFRDGMVPQVDGDAIRQEALHWALLRSLIGEYADQRARMPGFLEKGIPYS